MRRIAIGLTAAAAVLLVASLSAQGKPNFAGKWTLQPDPNAGAPAGAPGGLHGRPLRKRLRARLLPEAAAVLS